MLTFWSDKIPVVAICFVCIILYCLINLFAVKWYGESEFWLASGKLLLIGIVFGFTFVTMVCIKTRIEKVFTEHSRLAAILNTMPMASAIGTTLAHLQNTLRLEHLAGLKVSLLRYMKVLLL